MLKRLLVGGAVLGGAAVLARRLASGGDSDDRARHVSQTPEEYRGARHRVLILGAGFGGVSAALELDRRLSAADDASVLVVDRDNSMLFTPLLWTVADGRSNPNDVVVPIRNFQRGRRYHVLQANVEAIDLENRVVRTSAGDRPYDHLVIALGSVTVVPGLPGLREHARLFHTPADALELRNHLIDAIEAAHSLQDPEERAAWLTFVVGGGGDTGVELAATIMTYIRAGLFAEYPWLASESVRVVVVGRADRLVPMSSPRASREVQRALEGEGIEVMTGVSVEGVTDRAVKTSRGDIPSRTIFWAAGVAPPPLVRDLPVEHAKNGALIVDDHLRLKGYPEVYVVGDSAWAFDSATGTGIPPTAQAAEHEGRYVGQAIAAEITGRGAPPFRFAPRGHLALLGTRTGVAEVGGVTFSGLPAWALWHGYYVSHIPAWRNRVRLLTDWLAAEITGRETSQLRLGRDTVWKDEAALARETGSGGG